MSRKSVDSKKLLKSGLGAIKRKEYKKAIKKITESINYDEEIAKIPLVWLNLGVAHVNLKRYEEALNAFSQAVEMDRKDSEAWLKKGLLEFNLERYSASEKSLNSSIKHADKNFQDLTPVVFRARSLSKLKKYKVANKLLTKYFKKTNSSKLLNELFHIEKEVDEAKAIQILVDNHLKANDQNSSILLTLELMNNQQYDLVLINGMQALAKYPKEQTLLYGIAISFHEKSKRTIDQKEREKLLKQAITNYEEASHILKNQSLLISLSKAYIEMEEYQKAVNTLHRAKKAKKKGNAEIFQMLAEIYITQEKYDKAELQLEEAERIERTNPKTQFLQGMILQKTEKVSEAKNKYIQCINLDENYFDAYTYLAQCELQENNVKSALEWIEKVLAKNKGFEPAIRMKALIEVREGDETNAKKTIETHLLENPFDIQTLAFYIELFEKKDKDGISLFIKTLIEKYPDLKSLFSKIDKFSKILDSF